MSRQRAKGIARISRSSMFRVIVLLLIFLRPLSAHNGAVAIAVPVEGIVVDGDLTDWPKGMTEYEIGLAESGAPPLDALDFTGSFRVGYDSVNTALYVAIEVEDESTVIAGGGPWNASDGCEVYVDMDSDHGEGDGSPLQYVIRGDLLGTSATSSQLKEHEVRVLRRGSRHMYEWKLSLERDVTNEITGFDVAVLDRDEDGSFSWITWGGRVFKYQSRYRMGDLFVPIGSASTGKARGTIVWEDVAEGAEYGEVRAESRDHDLVSVTSTDSGGKYEFTLPSGSYRVTAGYRRQALEVATVEILPSEELALSNKVFPRPPMGFRVATPAGTVRDAGKGRTVKAGHGSRQGAWRSYGVADGLLSPQILSIHQDRRGNLWFGTDGGGVSRYDGESITTFTTNDGLASNFVRSVFEDGDGNIWMGTGGLRTEGQGLSVYDGERFRTLDAADGLTGSTVYAIAEDSRGRLWIGTDGGANAFDGDTLVSLTEADGLGLPPIRSVICDPDGDLWFATVEGAYRLSGERLTGLTTEDGLVSNSVFTILADSKGTLWFGTNGAVSKLDGDTTTNLTTEDGIAPTSIFSIVEDQDGAIWFGSDNTGFGVSRYDGSELAEFTTEDGLANNIVFQILQDREGSIWFATLGGVSSYDRGRSMTLTAEDGLASSTVRALHIDKRGWAWVGTPEGVSSIRGSEIATFAAEQGLAGDDVRLFFEDSQQRVWIASTDGVSVYTEDGLAAYTKDDGLPSNDIWAIAEDKRGDLWFGTEQGVTRFDGTRFVSLGPEDGLAQGGVHEIHSDRDGKLWFGSSSFLTVYNDGEIEKLGDDIVDIREFLEAPDGALWLRPGSRNGVARCQGKTCRWFGVEDGLPSSMVNGLISDHHGNIWFSTWGGGLSEFDGQGFRTLTTSDGLTSNFLSGGLHVDHAGRLWAGSLSGVSILSGDVFQTYLGRDGLHGNTIAAIAEDPDGNIWLSGPQGVTRYRPGHNSPEVEITQVVWDKKHVDIDEVLISADQQYLAFEFLVRTYGSRPGQVVYEYRLRGHDEEWFQSREPRAEYGALPIGDYVFEVRAVDRDLNRSATLTTMPVTVYPEYGWIAAQVALGSSLAGLLFAVVYAYRRRRDQRHAELMLMQEMESELREARRLQRDLMPTVSPDTPGLDIAGSCQTATQVGGDLFQYHDDAQLSVSIADVTGHAMEAAIPVVMFSGILDKQMEFPGNLTERFASLNRSLCRSLSDHKFICFTMAEIDTDTRRLRLASCGSPYPLHVHNGEVTELKVDGYPLGVRPETTYDTIETQLAEGDYLVMYSDGIPETVKAKDEMFGYERTIETVREACMEGISAEDLVERLMSKAREFAGDEPQADDMTCVVVRVEAS